MIEFKDWYYQDVIEIEEGIVSQVDQWRTK